MRKYLHTAEGKNLKVPKSKSISKLLRCRFSQLERVAEASATERIGRRQSRLANLSTVSVRARLVGILKIRKKKEGERERKMEGEEREIWEGEGGEREGGGRDAWIEEGEGERGRRRRASPLIPPS